MVLGGCRSFLLLVTTHYTAFIYNSIAAISLTLTKQCICRRTVLPVKVISFQRELYNIAL